MKGVRAPMRACALACMRACAGALERVYVGGGNGGALTAGRTRAGAQSEPGSQSAAGVRADEPTRNTSTSCGSTGSCAGRAGQVLVWAGRREGGNKVAEGRAQTVGGRAARG